MHFFQKHRSVAAIFFFLIVLSGFFVVSMPKVLAVDSRCYYNPLFVFGNPDKCSSLNDKNPYCANPADCGIQPGIDATKSNIKGVATTQSIKALVLGWLDFLFGYLVFFAVILIIGAGIYIIVSIGNETAFKKATKIILYLIAGFVIILLAYAIVNTVLRVLT